MNSDPEIVTLETLKGAVPKLAIVKLALQQPVHHGGIVIHPESTKYEEGTAGLHGKTQRRA